MLKTVLLKTAALAVALALPLAAAPALAATLAVSTPRPVEVLAKEHSSNGGLGTGLATGLVLKPGLTLIVDADPRDTWRLGNNTPCTRTSTANGLSNCYGAYTLGDFTALYGSLVGRIGTGDFFLIGTQFEAVVADAGELFLFAWDNNKDDNSGAITVVISAVPLPAGGLLLLGTLGGLAALQRRRG